MLFAPALVSFPRPPAAAFLPLLESPRRSHVVLPRNFSFSFHRLIIPRGASVFLGQLAAFVACVSAEGSAGSRIPIASHPKHTHTHSEAALRAWLPACVTNSTRFVVVCRALIKMWVLSEKENPWHSSKHHVTRFLSKQLLASVCALLRIFALLFRLIAIANFGSFPNANYCHHVATRIF